MNKKLFKSTLEDSLINKALHPDVDKFLSTEERMKIVNDYIIFCHNNKNNDKKYGEYNLSIIEKNNEKLNENIKKYLNKDIDKIDILENIADAYIDILYLQKIFNINDLELQTAIDIKLEKENKIK